MRSIGPSVWFLFALALVACGGSTPCEDALDHTESCGIEGLELTKTAEECGPYAECQAGCIQRASCNQIRAVLNLEENALTECLFQCGE